MVSMVRDAEEYKNIKLFLKGKGDDLPLNKKVKYRLKKKSEHFIIIENLLYLKDNEGLHKRVFHGEQEDLMELEAKRFHKSNHYGINRFEHACKEQYFKIPRTITRKVVADCVTCSQSQPLKTKETQVHIVAKCPMERLMIDLIDMKKYKEVNCGFTFILTVIDVYSKFAWAFPLIKKSGKEVVDKLETLFLTCTGPPLIIQSDNGKEFINSEMKSLAERFKICLKHSRPRNPKANGQVERLNQTLTRYLQKHIFEEETFFGLTDKTWAKHLNGVVYDYNRAKHSATGKSPFRLFLQIPGFNTITRKDTDDLLKDHEFFESEEDRKVNNSEDISSQICESAHINTDAPSMTKEWEPSVSVEYLKRMDRHSLVHSSKYDVSLGDKVMVSLDFDNNLKTKKLKLSSFYSEASEVIEKLSNNRIKIKSIDGKEEIVPLSRVKKFNK